MFHTIKQCIKDRWYAWTSYHYLHCEIKNAYYSKWTISSSFSALWENPTLTGPNWRLSTQVSSVMSTQNIWMEFPTGQQQVQNENGELLGLKNIAITCILIIILWAVFCWNKVFCLVMICFSWEENLILWPLVINILTG